MKRIKDNLYFGPFEGNKFFRAISLYSTILGETNEVIQRSIAHEKAHMKKIMEFGKEDCIIGYVINRKEGYAVNIWGYSEFSDEEKIQIAMAPEAPSSTDFNLAFGSLGFWKRYKTKIKGKIKDYSQSQLKNMILREAGGLQ
jgi:hypothetical protein